MGYREWEGREVLFYATTNAVKPGFPIHVTRSQTVPDGPIANTFTFCDCICDSVFHMRDCFTGPHLVTSRKQDVKIEFFAIIGDWSGMNVKDVSNLRPSHRKLFVTELRGYGN